MHRNTSKADAMREDEKQMSAVIRTISILEALSKTDRINLENLSKETELPKATLLRFLSTLISLGYVFRDGADMYHLTMKMFAVGSRSLKHIDLINTAIPFAKELSDELGETVHMAIMEEGNAVYVLKEESKYTLRMYSRVGKVIPLYCTAIGKIFLTGMSRKERDEYYARTPLKPFTAKSICSAENLEKQLGISEERGWAIDDEEHEDNVICIAAPVRDSSESIIASISTSWPTFRFDRNHIEQYAEKVKEAADKLSGVLGYCPSDENHIN